MGLGFRGGGRAGGVSVVVEMAEEGGWGEVVLKRREEKEGREMAKLMIGID